MLLNSIINLEKFEHHVKIDNFNQVDIFYYKELNQPSYGHTFILVKGLNVSPESQYMRRYSYTPYTFEHLSTGTLPLLKEKCQKFIE